MYKICPTCLQATSFNAEYCSECGTKMVDFDLVCECGAKISPYFAYRWFPIMRRSTKPINTHCTSCGRNIVEPVKNYIEEIQRTWKHKKKGGD